jgi:hypothetical protein
MSRMTNPSPEVQLALGRLFRMLSRPWQPGDDAVFFKCRAIILDAADEAGIVPKDDRVNWARDRLKGAQGD